MTKQEVLTMIVSLPDDAKISIYMGGENGDFYSTFDLYNDTGDSDTWYFDVID